ncbi:DUF5668 domain-containing protein [Rossellomorea aquimaris]|uniref:LiaI-LiaF-like domain-containing protein n=1 Tax=Rossellomorea aquimaris TaxID=189382 RepID=UPI001CD2D1B3|nr:DUF5668 domain-containing protein [Rossellomorea aquimaris]MCA1056342.1 DUF5668 domain-containing protein [Rossellomorea aquimaris]
MKQQKYFPGLILIGFGLYFYLQQANIVLFQNFFTWPTLLLIVGIAFLGQGYAGRDYEAILPGTILVGFGIHFHVVNKLELWPDHMGTFILIISLGFLLRYQKTGNGLFQGILFLALSVILLFSDRAAVWLGLIEGRVGSAWEFWPIVIILTGAYLLFIRKK